MISVSVTPAHSALGDDTFSNAIGAMQWLGLGLAAVFLFIVYKGALK